MLNKTCITFLFLLAGSAACRSKNNAEEKQLSESLVQTPVTIGVVNVGPLREYLELNGTASFLQSNIVKANANGYIRSIHVAPGQLVEAGKTLFTIQTKESKNIGSIITNLDSTFRFTGISSIAASQAGYITQLSHQLGDYVQDGEQLAAISTSNSFGFIVNVPYELNRYVTINKPVQVELPDGRILEGKITSMMPAVDSVSQTQRVLVRVNSQGSIPENLIARIKILKSQKEGAITLPKEAVLSDESQSTFWVMKLIDSVTAVKLPVNRGIESGGKIEILQSSLVAGDRVLTSGNYGLADTARVKVVRVE